ncbi:unnamed protein product, partial [Pleuronectes platessa]
MEQLPVRLTASSSSPLCLLQTQGSEVSLKDVQIPERAAEINWIQSFKCGLYESGPGRAELNRCRSNVFTLETSITDSCLFFSVSPSEQRPHVLSSSLTLSLCPQVAVIRDTPPAEGLSENDSGVELTNENSPLTAAEPPSPFSPKQNGDAASPPDDNQCSRGNRKRTKKSSEDEEATWDSYSDEKGSGPSQLGLRQTPRPRTIFQAGLTPHSHNKARRPNRKQEHVLSLCALGSRVVALVSGEVPEAPRLDLMEQDSKDSAQSSSTMSSSEAQPEYN